MARRSDVLALAVLGLLKESPLHGYELRKRLNVLLGSLRAFSYGSLYPCLRELLTAGHIAEAAAADDAGPPLSGRRAKIVYRLTPAGQQHFGELLADAGPASWEDDRFGVHFAFFRHADAEIRLRVLEGRRSRLEERRERVRAAFTRTRERLDSYTLELQRHGLESVEREVRWLAELIADERQRGADPHRQATPPAGMGSPPDLVSAEPSVAPHGPTPPLRVADPWIPTSAPTTSSTFPATPATASPSIT